MQVHECKQDMPDNLEGLAYRNKQRSRPQEVVPVQGGILHYAKQITSAASDGAQVLDCVIVVPPFFGPAQRQALYDAAHLAGDRRTPAMCHLPSPLSSCVALEAVWLQCKQTLCNVETSC